MVQGGDIAVKLVNVIGVYFLLSSHRLGHVLDQLPGCVTKGSRAVEYRCDKGVVHIFQKGFGGLYFYIIVGGIVLALSGKIILILVRFLGLAGDRYVAFCFRVSGLHLIGKQILGEKPGCSTSWESFLLNTHTEGPWEIIWGFCRSNWGMVITSVSKSTSASELISTSGA